MLTKTYIEYITCIYKIYANETEAGLPPLPNSSQVKIFKKDGVNYIQLKDGTHKAVPTDLETTPGKVFTKQAALFLTLNKLGVDISPEAYSLLAPGIGLAYIGYMLQRTLSDGGVQLGCCGC